jgi:hypothetical protein
MRYLVAVVVWVSLTAAASAQHRVMLPGTSWGWGSGGIVALPTQYYSVPSHHAMAGHHKHAAKGGHGLAGKYTGSDNTGDTYSLTIAGNGSVSGTVGMGGSGNQPVTGQLTEHGNKVSGTINMFGSPMTASGTIKGSQLTLNVNGGGFTATLTLKK